MNIWSGKRKAGAARVAAVVMAIVMSLSLSFSSVSYANTELQDRDVSMDEVKTGIRSVVESVDKLKDVLDLDPEEQSALKDIFNSFTELAGGVTTVIGAINTASTFLKLIGVMKDPAAAALADINRQLKNINEKLADMDRKLDDISEEMAKMEATSELNFRGVKAGQMMSEWHKFEHDYMENGMDELLNKYDVMMRNHISDWIEFKKEGSRQSDSDYVRTDRIVMLYKGGNPLDQDAKMSFMPVSVNDIDPVNNKRDVSNPDPYTMYADDDNLNPEHDSFLILDDTFLPAKGEIKWNVNTYREDLIAFFKGKLKALKENAQDPAVKDHYKVHRMKIDEWSDEDIDKYAEEAVDSLMYRINYVMINESADFAKDVYKKFGEYCAHVNGTQQGVSAMLSSIYLTNAFEFEARDAIKAFCNQMILKTGVYSMFATNILGMSEYITDKEKMDIARNMCDSIKTVEASLNNGITGMDNYCYVTNTALSYADVTFSSGVTVDFHIRGAAQGYDEYYANGLKTNYSSDEDPGSQPVLVGDSNALLIGYLLRGNGRVMDHDFMNKYFSTTKRTKKSAVITSLKGEQEMTVDTPLTMQSHNIIGGYFKGDPKVRLSSLPKSAEEEYLVYRKRITGSTVDFNTLALSQNRALFGTAIYGESHFTWQEDESAVLGGPADDPSFKENFEKKRIEPGIITDSHRAYYNNSVQYNCLLQIPVTLLKDAPGPYVLDDFAEMSEKMEASSEARAELDKLIKKAVKAKNFRGWTSESIREFRGIIAEAKEVCENLYTSAREIAIEKKRLQAAWDYYKSIAKKDQKMTVKAVKKTVKAKDLKKGKKVIKVITVKNSKGKVTYRKMSVVKKKFAKKFAVNKTNGKITIKKGLKKGAYKIRIRVKAAGNSKYLPMKKTVTVRVVVK